MLAAMTVCSTRVIGSRRFLWLVLLLWPAVTSASPLGPGSIIVHAKLDAAIRSGDVRVVASDGAEIPG
jgi:hypothetical protein